VLRRPADVLAGCHLRDGPALRAGALAAAVGAPEPPAAFAFRTAAWIHTGGPEPRLLEIATPCSARGLAAPGVRPRRVALPAHHVAEIGGVRVTTRARTAADLARDLTARDAVAWLDRLRVSDGAVARTLDETAEVRHTTSARRLLSCWTCP
jgi:hypothetical protein